MIGGSAVDRIKGLPPEQALYQLALVIDEAITEIRASRVDVHHVDDKLDEVDKRNLNRTIGILAALLTAVVMVVVDIVVRGTGGG